MGLTRYAAVHEQPEGPGDARPTALQVIEDESLHNGQLTGKTILITGVSSGIGVEVAKALFVTGATLFLTARDLNKAKRALGEALVNSPRVHLMGLHLDSLESVRACAARFYKQSNKILNVFIANAGVLAAIEGRTKDGFETQFGTNHLGHFLLFCLLRPALLDAANATGSESRAVFVSSLGHRYGEVDFDDYNFEKRPYSPHKAYGQSKTANIWTSNEADRLYNSHGLRSFSVQPGAIMETGLSTYISEERKQILRKDPNLGPRLKSPEQGAATIVWAAVSKSLEKTGGKYLEDAQIAKPWSPEHGDWATGYATHVYSPEKERKLWALSLELVHLDE
jgi:NAD(P)-dependent dehydrogenase (short-subunit alcohol dehydrogenase family)